MIAFGLLLLVLMLCGALWGSRRERAEWNGGICKASSLPWRHFDNDSQGGRGYTDGEGNYCWQSWGHDKP